MPDRVFLDHAATTPVRTEVIECMLSLLGNPGMNPSASYGSARRARGILEDAREEIAGLLGAKATDIYFTSGGTESDNWALRALLQPDRKHIVTSRAEHHAVLATCSELENEGCEVTYVPVDHAAGTDAQFIEQALRKDTAVVSVMLANNETGTVNDVARIARTAHDAGVPYHCDAVAACGHVPIQADEMGIDLLSISAHKFYGPPGVGALMIGGHLKPRRFIYGGRQERNLRAGTQNVAAAVGMARALRLASAEMEKEKERLLTVRRAFADAVLDAVPKARIITPFTDSLPGTLSIHVPGLEARAALIQLDRDGFEISAGAACAAGAAAASHVLLASGMSEREARCVIRVSLGRSTEPSHAQPFADSLAGAAERASTFAR